MFPLSILCLSALTILLPFILPLVEKIIPAFKFNKANPILPVLAAVLLVVSVLLPDIHISKETTTFQQHFVGGGVYSALLYAYAKQLFGWKLNLLSDFLLLFAWVSAFGVANKLAEFALLKLGFSINTSDADWDLLANTLGAFACYLIIKVIDLKNT